MYFYMYYSFHLPNTLRGEYYYNSLLQRRNIYRHIKWIKWLALGLTRRGGEARIPTQQAGHGLEPSCGLPGRNGNNLCEWNQPITLNLTLELEREMVCVYMCVYEYVGDIGCGHMYMPFFGWLIKTKLTFHSNVNDISFDSSKNLWVWECILLRPF